MLAVAIRDMLISNEESVRAFGENSNSDIIANNRGLLELCKIFVNIAYFRERISRYLAPANLLYRFIK